MADVETVTILGLLVDRISGPSRTIQSGLSGVESAADSLTAKLKGLIAGYLGFQTVSKALAEGREAAEAQERLRAAALGNKNLIDAINEEVEKLARTTTVEKTALQNLAGQLLNRGVGADQIATALKASANLAAALGTDVTAAGEQLAMTLQGVIPRGIGRAVPELKKLSMASLEAGGAIDVINKKFEGFAQQRAQTDLGKVEQGENRIKEGFQAIGLILLKYEAQLLPAIANLVQRIASFLTSPAVVGALQTITDLIRGMIDNAGLLVSLYVSNRLLLWLANLVLAWRAVATSAAAANAAQVGTMTAYGKWIAQLGVLTGVLAGLAIGAHISNVHKLGDEIRGLPDVKKLVIDIAVIAHQQGGKATAKDIMAGLHDTLQAITSFSVEVPGTGLDSSDVIAKEQIDAANLARKSMAQIEQEAHAAAVKASQDAMSLLKESQKERAAVEDAGYQRSAAEEMKVETEKNEFLFKSRAESFQRYLDAKNQLESRDAREAFESARQREQELSSSFFQHVQAGIRGDPAAAAEAAHEIEALTAATKKRVQLEQQLNDVLASQTRTKAIAQLDAEKDAASQLNERLQQVDYLQQTGSISYIDALGQQTAAQEEYARRVDEAHAALKELYDEATDPDTQAAIIAITQQLDMQAQKTSQSFHSLATDIKEGLHDPVKGFFKDILTGAKSVKEAFSDMLGNIASKLADFAAEQLTNTALNTVFSFLSPFIGSFAGGIGGLAAGGSGVSGGLISISNVFAEGGRVPGSGPDVDSVPAMLTPNEFVMRRRAHLHYGTAAMEAINRMMIPASVIRRYAASPSFVGSTLNTGGVAGHDGTPTPVIAMVPPTEATMHHLLRGGVNALFDALAQNKSRLKNLVR